MKIYIWGTGFATSELLEKELSNIKIAGFIDSYKEEFRGAKCISPEQGTNLKYDAIIVCTGYAAEIYNEAIELSYDLDKFIFYYANLLPTDINRNYELVDRVLGEQYSYVIKNRYHVIRGMMYDDINKKKVAIENKTSGMYIDDYNRIRTFELLSDEIKSNNIDGNVAELGVFRGEFAKYINEVFSDRTLYLFDTFEGFRLEESEKEKENGNCGDAFIERFRNTNIQEVKNVMPNPTSIVFKQGLFPESLNGLEDSFAFVSIDVDFEQAIYDGLVYFVPRLTNGGYIMIHDYNSSTLRGVKSAIQNYEKKFEKLHKVPICDICGTLVLTK